VYTSCPAVCPTVTANLKRATDVATGMLGSNAFDVATIGFDTAHDGPGQMASYARERGIDAPNWWFLSADADAIANLTRALGFTYAAAGGGFEHMTQVSILDAQGRVYRQLYGDDVAAPTLVEPLKQLALGQSFASPTLANVLTSVRLVCSVYDPATGRYRFNYAIIATVLAGTLSLGGLGIFVARLWRTG
jgi:protein SCO1/2